MRKWVTVDEGTIYFCPATNGSGVFSVSQDGIIFEENEEVVNGYFPESYAELVVQKKDIINTTSFDFNFEAMCENVESFENQHCSAGEFAFNIKVGKVDIPDIVHEKLSWDTIEDHFNMIADDYINEFVTEMKSLFKWIVNWRIDGRSGGYIILDSATNSFAKDYDFDYNSAENDEDTETMQEIYNHIKELHFSLNYIELRKQRAMREFEEYIESIEAWEDFFDKAEW